MTRTVLAVAAVLCMLSLACRQVEDPLAPRARSVELALVKPGVTPQTKPVNPGGGNKPTHHVSGGGVAISGPDTAQFEFNAKEQRGVVTGHAEFRSTSGYAIRVVIDCLYVGGGEAWIGGTIVEASPGLPVGVGAIIRMIDHGEGHKVIDQISRPNVGTAQVCTDEPPIALLPVVEGNIQVR